MFPRTFLSDVPKRWHDLRLRRASMDEKGCAEPRMRFKLVRRTWMTPEQRWNLTVSPGNLPLQKSQRFTLGVSQFIWELATAKKIRPSGLQVSQCHLGACHLKNVSLLVWFFVSFIWGRATARMSAVQIANVVVSSRNLALIFNCLVRFSLGTVIFLRGHFYFQLFGWFFWALSFY